jgi:hypothetical protein
MAVTLKEQKIVDSWGMVIQGGQGKAESIFDTTQEILKSNEAPGVKWEMTEAQPGIIKGLFGKKRDYIMVTNEALKDYRMYIGSRDYGTNLDVAWFLTVEPGFFSKWVKAAQAVASFGIFGTLDIFDQQDLRAYVTVAHHAVLDAVNGLMQELGQDPTKIERKSKGFLEVW